MLDVTEPFNPHDVDRELLEIRILELEQEREQGSDRWDLGIEYESLCWFRDLFWLIDEGFFVVGPEGQMYTIEECPPCLE